MWDDDNERKAYWQGVLQRAALMAAIPAVYEAARRASGGDKRTLIDVCVALAFGAIRDQSDIDHLVDACNEITLLLGDAFPKTQRRRDA